jgi:Starch binding domain
MSFQVGRMAALAVVLGGCSGVADPSGLPAASGGDLQTLVDAAPGGDAASAPGSSSDARTRDAQAAWVTADAVSSNDASSTDASGLPEVIAATWSDATIADAAMAAALDGSPDVGEASGPVAAPSSCWVTFTVADAFIDGALDTTVAIGGDTTALGAWDPNSAVAMTSIGAGAWTVSLLMNDGDSIQFLFVKRGPSSYSWESWGVNSNRSLVVACSPDADVGDVVDGGPAIGTSYAGEFGVRPPDAT